MNSKHLARTPTKAVINKDDKGLTEYKVRRARLLEQSTLVQRVEKLEQLVEELRKKLG